MQQKNSNNGLIVTLHGATLVINGDTMTVPRSDSNFLEVVRLGMDGDWEAAKILASPAKTIANFTSGRCEVKNGQVFFEGDLVNNVVTQKILEFAQQKLPFKPLVNFLANCLENPRKMAVEELYLFLEQGEFVITEDGCFLAYKRIKDDYTSFHASPDGTHKRHRIGDDVFEDRNECDFNRQNTCSRGLHFCAKSYLPHYNGSEGRVVIVKVNPRDVVSIPNDYSNAKGRTCFYKVVSEWTQGSVDTNTSAFDRSLYPSSGVVDTTPKRDSKGRFCK